MDVSDADFYTFLQTIKMDKDSYIYAVRSSIRSKKIFIKRSLAEIRVNNYNPTLLRCWRANMDQQFVLDPDTCAMYIVSYITKSQRGMSNLLYHAAKAAREANSSIPEQVKFIGNKFLNNVEISAQEAVYLLLQIPLYRSSRDVAFINTSPVEICYGQKFVQLKIFPMIPKM